MSASATSPSSPYKLAEELQRLLGGLAAVVRPQLVELAPRVRHATDLGHVELEAGLLDAEFVSDELALPARLVLRSREATEAAYACSRFWAWIELVQRTHLALAER